MTSMSRLLAAVAAVALLALTTSAQQPPAAQTAASTITVPEMDCASCAKKLGEALVKVPGVAKAEYDVKGRTIKLTHKAGETPSAKALWEAVEKEDKQPSKLDVPGTSHTKKPTS